MRTSSRRRVCNLLLIIGLSAVPGAAADGSAAGRQGMAAELRRLVSRLPEPGAECSAAVVDLRNGKAVLEWNGDRPMIPASNAKLFVLAAAVEILGPTFEFRTVLAKRGRDLVVIGDGDPSLGDPRIAEEKGEAITAIFDRWADVIKQRGLSNIEGDLIVDETIFDSQWTHPDWSAGDLKRWYAAPVGGLNFNDNCIEVTVWPAKTAGAPAHWEAAPPTSIVKIVNECRSGGKGGAFIDRPNVSFEYRLTGHCQKRGTLQSVPVPDPGAFFADAFRTHLKRRGVTVRGQVRRERMRNASGALAPGCEVLATHTTPLSAVTARIGKNSQNMFAECLMKRLGYEWARRGGSANPVGSWQTGRAAIEAFLKRAGLDVARVTVADASGLSRTNRASASDFVKLLRYMHGRPDWDSFGRSLSVAGQDGSLRRRMKDVPGVVCAKTGSVSGVRTLSGYVETRDGKLYGFSVLFNGIKKKTAPFNSLHDSVCRTMATWKE